MDTQAVNIGGAVGLADQAARELNRMLFIDRGAEVASLQARNGWAGGVAGGAAMGVYHHGVGIGQQDGREHLGWGGQAIPDNSGYRVPWFGRNRGKSGSGRSKGRAKGVLMGDRAKARGGKTVWAKGTEQDGQGNAEDALSVEEVAGFVRSVPEGQMIPERVYQALANFDSRTASVLLKDLSKVGLGRRAFELFDHIRKLEPGHALRRLCDVYTYTAMISMCIYQQNVDRALELAQEMRDWGIERNVHTYTALMNVCIKCGRSQLALETYNRMRQDRIMPNVVTYNTLIDVYGKMGQWEQAVKVLALMKNEGVDPVLRTYNTLIIACNMCNQPREALAVYNRLVSEGFTPNATTYNALISAYGKAGQLEKVMEVFQEMVLKGCERSVITYSSLISACEKAGQWEIALELFNEMHQEGCVPNTVTYNSLITACAQGAQWEKASEVFEQLQVHGCTPDVVTYTALISAYERGGEWRRGLQAFEQMRSQGCRPDSIVYNAIIDAVWETGVIWAQRRALQIFRLALEQGHFKQQPLHGSQRVEVNLHAMTAGVAVLSLYSWLLDLKKTVVTQGSGSLPAELCIVTDKGRNSKEQGNLVVKEAVAAMMNAWDSPFRPVQDTMYSGVLEAPGSQVAEWLMAPVFEERLFSFFPCDDTIPGMANKPWDESIRNDIASALSDADFSKEMAVEARCAEAFTAVHSFESTHSLALQAMGLTYLQHRMQLVMSLIQCGRQLGLKDEIAHDAVLLMDRTMSTAIQIKDNLLELLSVACLVLAMKHAETMDNLPSNEDLERVTDCKASAVAKMEWNLRQVLGSDTATISTLRCLKLYLERLGANFLDAKSAQEVAGNAYTLVEDSMVDVTFLNCRPSVVAAAILYAERRSRGIIPFWPSMLAKLTGYQDMSSPELTVAIRGAQKLCQNLSKNRSNHAVHLQYPVSMVSSMLPNATGPLPLPIAAAVAGMQPQQGPSLVDLGGPPISAVEGVTGLTGLTTQQSLVSLPLIQNLQAMPPLHSLCSVSSTPSVGAGIQPGLKQEDQVTANHVNGIVQGLPQGVVHGVAHVVAPCIPQGIVQRVAQGVLSSAGSGNVPNVAFQQVAATSGVSPCTDLSNLGRGTNCSLTNARSC